MIVPWLWAKLPGNAFIKTVIATVLAVAIVVVLFEVVFPWISVRLPYQEQTVG
jgi:hypothetical protein